MTATKRRWPRLSRAQLEEIVGLALAGDYVPTLSQPEQCEDADLFDARMEQLGLAKRAWRGAASTECKSK